MSSKIMVQIWSIVIGIIINLLSNMSLKWPWYYNTLAISLVLNCLFLYMLNQREPKPPIENKDNKQNKFQFKQNNTEVVIEQNEPIKMDQIVTQINTLVSQDDS